MEVRLLIVLLYPYLNSNRSHGPGVAVGAGEIEEETVKELERTRRKLGQTETALAHVLKENTELRNELSAVKLASRSLSNI